MEEIREISFRLSCSNGDDFDFKLEISQKAWNEFKRLAKEKLHEQDDEAISKDSERTSQKGDFSDAYAENQMAELMGNAVGEFLVQNGVDLGKEFEEYGAKRWEEFRFEWM